MTVEALFRQFEAAGYSYPEPGSEVQYRQRGETEWRRGVVDYCWAGLEPMVKIVSGPDLCPSLGDEIRTEGETHD